MGQTYTPRPYQLGILCALDRGCKRAVWCVHRRAGKDLTVWNWVIQRALIKPQVIYYVFPTYSQAKKVIWDNMTKDGKRFLDYIPAEMIQSKNSSELKIRFTNGSLIQLAGSDDIDRLVGTNPSIIVYSEYAMQRPEAWSYLRPILAENGGTAVFISTPRGKNHYYDMIQRNKGNPEWYIEILGCNDTKAISEKDIQAEVDQGMSPDMVQQEFYCSFELGVEGSYYADYLRKAYDEERICSVPHNKKRKVYTAWDLGYNDSMCVLYFQVHGEIINIIDCYECNRKSLEEVLQTLKAKPYMYGGHFIPHDGASHKGVTHDTYVTKARELGFSFTVLKMTGIDIGIDNVRSMFGRLWFDKINCAHLLKCLENYRKVFDETHRVYRPRPLHDWSSHMSDSLRYLCQAVSDGIDDRASVMTDAEVNRLQNIYQPVFH